MVHKLIQWAIDNKFIVLILSLGLVVFGGYSFIHVNVEAYPDPAPAIVEVIAKFPGASAEEVERQVTIPLEVAIAGIPGLKYTRTKSLFGLSHLRNQFEYGVDFQKARQEIINRLQFVDGLPQGVVPTLSPQSPTGEIFRYTLKNPKTEMGKDVYTLNDLKSMQDTVLERQFRRVPRIIDIVSSGGTVKRYEIHPDPERLMRYEVTTDQLAQAIQDSNANVGGDYMVQGDNLLNIRAIGLIGGGQDPTRDPAVMLAPTPEAAAEYLRNEELRRIERIRSTVIKAVNHQPIKVEDVVDGGPNRDPDQLGMRGVVVGNLPRLGRASISYRKTDDEGKLLKDKSGEPIWIDEDEKVQGIVLLRKGEASLPALNALEKKVDELNNPTSGRLLPGVKIQKYYDRTELINVTTETVHENLIVGMVLVTLILLMFLSNVRSALIVAINIPLALLFAFVVLFVRGKSANLLSIGAVDFGIIVDSSVIMVENIYRHLSAGDNKELPFRDRILIACREVESGLFFTTAIMVCAFLPLFTMQGPEGQIFGPMADTYAFALGGALLMALTIAPVLCALFFTKLKPVEDNFLVRTLKHRYLKNLDLYLRHRYVTLGVMGFLIVITAGLLPFIGREFMPELEEGNLWIRGTFPISIAQDAAAIKIRESRKIMQKYPEIDVIVSMNGRPDDGTDPTGFYNSEFFVPLKPRSEWDPVKPESGILSFFYPKRSRTKEELISEMNRELEDNIFGVDWNFSQNIRDNVMESLSGVKGDNSVKIFGPDLDELERLAGQLKTRLEQIQGIENVGIFRVKGQPNLEIPVDPVKCARWGLSVEDIEDVIETAVGGKPFSTMVEGEKRFDITLRWPAALRSSEESILDIPVDISNNNINDDTSNNSDTNDILTNDNAPFNRGGFNEPQPALSGNPVSSQFNYIMRQPRRRLRDFVTPVNSRGIPDKREDFIRSGASTIYREQGNRLIAVKFSVRGRDLASAVAEAQGKTEDLFKTPYTTEWSGEFQEMKEAEARLMIIIPVSLVLIFILLYLAFHSLLDACVVLSNVLDLSVGGIWALYLTGTNFSISAAVGFISLFGVAIMDGLLMISYFNHLRHQGLPLREAIMPGAEKRVRPVTMTALTAIFGLLPAAMSTRIGAQTQRPLAIVVVGGMIATLFLTRYLMPILYSFYGHREPNDVSSSLVH